MKQPLVWGTILVVVLFVLGGAFLFLRFGVAPTLEPGGMVPQNPTSTAPVNTVTPPTTQPVPTPVLYDVGLQSGVSLAEGRAIVTNLGGEVLNDISFAHIILQARLTDDQAASLARNSKILWVGKEQTKQPLGPDAVFSPLFNIAYAATSQPAQLFILGDGGIHGTEVANSALSVIISTGANVQLHAITIPKNSRGQFDNYNVAIAIKSAVDSGANVINISASCAAMSNCNTTQIEQEALDYAHSKGVIVVVSAGNTPGALSEYASDPAVITAGGLMSSGCVDTSLSGDTAANQATFYASPFTPDNRGHGTSFASPRIAGYAASIMSQPVGSYDANGNGKWDSGEVEAALKAGESSNTAYTDGQTLWANNGCVAPATVAQTPTPIAPTPPTPPTTVASQLTPVTITPAQTIPGASGPGGPLVPGSGSPTDYNLCTLRDLASNVITFAVYLSVFVATLMFAYGGILYVAGSANEGNIKKAHSVFLKTFVGLVIVLIAWLIVNIVLSVLTGQSVLQWTNWFSNGSAGCSKIAVSAPLSQGGTQGKITGGPGPSAGACTDCKNITAFLCKNPESCQVSAGVNANLDQMAKNLGCADALDCSQYEITETGAGQTVTHASGSTNLDMGCEGSAKSADGTCSTGWVQHVAGAWQGGTAVYETNSRDDYNQKVQSGISTSNILFIGGAFDSSGHCTAGVGHCITAPHVSLNYTH